MSRTIIVTGASRGIGLATCQRLLLRGYHVVGVARERTAAFADLQTSHGSTAEFVSADLGCQSGIATVTDRIRRCERLHGLINNAGIASGGLHMTLPQANMATMIAVNLMAPMTLSQVAIRSMSRQRSGRIVNVSSISANRAYRGLAAYSATKAALEGFTRVLAAEVGAWGITVNCVAPGFVDTAMSAPLDDNVKAAIQRRTMLPQPTTACDVAAAIEFLLSDAASSVTAEVLRIDGGSAA